MFRQVKPPTIFLGLTFQSESAQLSAIEFKNESFEILFEQSIPSLDEIPKNLIELFKGMSIGISLPDTMAIHRTLTFDLELSEEDLIETVQLELSRILPYRLEDAYWDCHRQKDSNQVLVVAVPKKQIAPYVEKIKSLELNLSLITFDSYALKNLSQRTTQHSLAVEIALETREHHDY